jgi:hypothetical protein
VLSLVFAPVTFYQTRLRRPASWRLACGGPLGCGALAIASHVIFATKITGPLFDSLTAFGVSTAFATSMQYMGAFNVGCVYVLVWLSTSAFMIAFDVLARESPHPARIIETNALAFYSQLPWLAALVAVAVVFEPPVWVADPAGPSVSDLERFKRLLQQDQVLIAVRAVNGCFAAWLYGLFGAGYHAVAGMSLGRSLALTMSMFGAFHLLATLI